MTPIDLDASLENLKLERDAVYLYDALATIERDPTRAAAFERIATNERRHADIWAAKLTELGATVPPVDRPRARVRFIIWVARLFGTRAVADLVKALEGDEEAIYQGQGTSPEVAAIAADEREHARIWDRLQADDDGDGRRRRPALRSEPTVPAVPGAAAVTATTIGEPADIKKAEQWHRATGRSGTLRAIIFGVSDGLVSNLALVMGVVGAVAEDSQFILLAGIAGLLAGAFSMAAGEYISMQSQRELFERQIALERSEIEAMPEEEQAELATIYRAKGFAPDEADRIAERIFGDPELALDTLVREELGLDPDELGSPWGAAGGSFAAFAIGAAVPVLPFLFGGGTAIVILSLAISAAALFAVGAGVSLLTGRSMLFSGTRQLVIGIGAAAITFIVGSLIGVTVS